MTNDREPGAEPGGREAGDEPDELVGVGADVAAAARGPGLGRVDPPGGLLLAVGLEVRGEPALRIPGLDLADLADRAVLDQLLGEHDHREAGIGVGDDERGLALRSTTCCSRLASSRVVVSGFSQRTPIPADGGGVGRAVVGVVGGDDRHVVDPLAIRQRGLGLRSSTASRRSLGRRRAPWPTRSTPRACSGGPRRSARPSCPSGSPGGGEPRRSSPARPPRPSPPAACVSSRRTPTFEIARHRRFAVGNGEHTPAPSATSGRRPDRRIEPPRRQVRQENAERERDSSRFFPSSSLANLRLGGSILSCFSPPRPRAPA